MNKELKIDAVKRILEVYVADVGWIKPEHEQLTLEGLAKIIIDELFP